MCKVINARDGVPISDAIYVGRPSDFGNPFTIGVHGNRKQVIEKYKALVAKDPAFIKRIKKELKGKDLICWCAPKACHADILLEIANS